MSHNTSSVDMQGHDNDTQEPIDSKQELIRDFQRRLADPDSLVSYQMILEVFAQAVTNSAQELETTLLTALVPAEDSSAAIKTEHIARVVDSLHNRLDFVQEFLDATPLPTQTRTDVQVRQVQQLESDTESARKVVEKSAFACGMLLVLIFSAIVDSQWQDYDWLHRINAMSCLSLFSFAMLHFVILP